MNTKFDQLIARFKKSKLVISNIFNNYGKIFISMCNNRLDINCDYLVDTLKELFIIIYINKKKERRNSIIFTH
jgi:hypothetical protein